MVIELSEFINQNLLTVMAVIIVFTFLISIVALVSMIEIIKLKKFIKVLTGGDKEMETLEEKFEKFYKTTNEINDKYDKITEAVFDINKNMDKCVQKVGVVRYNPFDEAGGNLCYAVALLDSENNGVILNGIHSRSGCFTYAKPIEIGVSEYVLSQEELQALNIALEETEVSKTRQQAVKEIQERLEKESSKRRTSKVKVYSNSDEKVTSN